MRRTSAALVAVAAVGALVLSACSSSSDGGASSSNSSSSSGATGSGAASGGSSSSSSSSSSTSAPVVPGGTFTTAFGTDAGNLDPNLTVMSAARAIDAYLYDTLLLQNNDGSLAPSLAEKWEGDTTKATFTLRKGIKCSDGSDVTATTIADTLNFIADPKNKSPLAGLQVMPGSTAVADDAAGTVTYTSKTPDAFLLINLGSVMMPCGKGLTDRSLLSKGQSGTGLFQISEVVPNDHYTMTKRTDYTWGPNSVTSQTAGLPDKVVVKIVPNETTVANLLTSGQLNAAQVIGPDKQRLDAAKVPHSDYRATLGEIWFNQNPARPAKDPAVRKALIQAIDLGEAGKVLSGGTGKVSTSFVAFDPSVCKGDSVSGNYPATDPAAAAAGLDAAGWKAGPDGIRVKDGKKLSIKLIYTTITGPQGSATAELLSQKWKAIGVDATISAVDSPGLSQVLFQSGDWDASLGGVGINLPSMLVPFVSGPTPPQGVNFAYIDNKAYQTSIAAAATKPGAAGCDDWMAAEAALVKDIDGIPFVDTVVPIFTKGAHFEVSGGGILPSSIRMGG